MKKDILQLLLIATPMFIVAAIGWLNSPMYADVKAKQRLTAQEYLIETYFYGDIPSLVRLRQEIIEEYGFTNDEINPSGILDQFAKETRYSQNLGALK